MRPSWVRPILEALLGLAAALLGLAGAALRADPRRGTRTFEGRCAPADGLADPTAARLLADDGVDEATRVALAGAWRASALAAQRALADSTWRALALIGLGAPSELVARAHETALAEVGSVKVHVEIARSLDGRSAPVFVDTLRAPPPRSRAASLALLATEIVVEVALVAGCSSRRAAKLARRTTDRTIRAALEETSALDARRVAHAWSVVRWCVDEGGPPVEHALRALVGRLPRATMEVPREALTGGWERWGIAGASLEQQAHAHAHELVERTLHELVSTAARRSRLAAA